MTLKKEKEKELFLDFSHDYQQAVFGSFHIAFMTRDENYVLPKEDFDSLKMDALIDEAVENTVVYTFSDQGEEIECEEVRKTEDGEV